MQSQTQTTVNPVLTVREVAEHYRLKEKTVYMLAKAGKIPGAFKIGGSLRFDRDAVMAARGEAHK